MHKSLAVLLAGIILGYGGTVLAREGGVNSGHSGHSGHSGGSASERMSEQGSQNSNAQWSSDSAKGKERSGQRNSDNDGHQSHGKGGDHGKDMDMERATERDMISTISTAPTNARGSELQRGFFEKR